jgi:hypothetical protein
MRLFTPTDADPAAPDCHEGSGASSDLSQLTRPWHSK